jgi:hypothetical protein
VVLAGMGGVVGRRRTLGTRRRTALRSAPRLAAEKQDDIYRYHPMAPKGLSYTNKADRRKIHKIVYDGCVWIDLDAIEGEAAELIAVDPGQGERFFGNRPVAGEGVAFDIDVINSLARPARCRRAS